MKQYGLLGFPLVHSFSCSYFTEKFRIEDIDATYQNFSTPNLNLFPRLIEDNLLLSGLNVTIPYKQAIISYLDSLDPEAESIGAVNVIKIIRDSNGKPHLTGYNSDLTGFRESIRPFIDNLHNRIKKNGHELNANKTLKALILGTGGVSKAIKYGLEQLGIETMLVSRTPAPGLFTYNQLNEHTYKDYTIIVNATPLGTTPKIDTCPPIHYESITPDHLLFDVVYNPEKTLFLKKGERRGATIKNGLEMLHLQAETSWKIWNQE
jgi:shikimate dehydrogenase